MSIQNAYLNKVYEDVVKRNPNEPEFQQAVYEVLESLVPVVEQDEKESGIRKILNFGHTIGHGIESTNEDGLYHGECVALGLIPMCGEEIRPRVINVLKKCGLYNSIDFNWDKISEAMFHDKKADGDTIDVIMVSETGKFEIKKLKCIQVIEIAEECLGW